MAAHAAHKAENKGHHEGGSSSHHIIPFSTYMNVFWTLIALTVVTVAAAQFNFGAFNTLIAFAIASVKASLVLLYFMHLKYDNRMNQVIIGCSVIFLLIFYFFSIVDEVTRILVTPTL